MNPEIGGTILKLLSDGRPRTIAEIAAATGINVNSVRQSCDTTLKVPRVVSAVAGDDQTRRYALVTLESAR